ncbi:MAG: hypothetical protein E7353_02115 [Clostridiales bacterium]|nr:hypothetical protein [Clostridiales bacterium]
MKEKNQNILRALIAVALSLCVALLSVWAVVTEKADINLAINVGKASSFARVTRFNTYSNGKVQDSFDNYVSEFGGRFGEYGTATLRENILSLNRLRVDDRVDFVIEFTDKSSVDIQYRVVLECANDYYGMYEGLKVKVGSNYLDTTEYECSYIDGQPAPIESEWAMFPKGRDFDRIFVTVMLPQEGSAYSGRGTQLSVSVHVIPHT